MTGAGSVLGNLATDRHNDAAGSHGINSGGKGAPASVSAGRHGAEGNEPVTETVPPNRTLTNG